MEQHTSHLYIYIYKKKSTIYTEFLYLFRDYAGEIEITIQIEPKVYIDQMFVVFNKGAAEKLLYPPGDTTELCCQKDQQTEHLTFFFMYILIIFSSLKVF